MRILLDENTAVGLVAPLSERGHDAKHVELLKRKGHSDRSQLGWAAESWDCFITLDRFDDRPSRLSAFEAMRAGLRIVFISQPSDERFTLELQTAYLFHHIEEVERQTADPGGARLIRILNRGRNLELLSPADIEQWFADYAERIRRDPRR